MYCIDLYSISSCIMHQVYCIGILGSRWYPRVSGSRGKRCCQKTLTSSKETLATPLPFLTPSVWSETKWPAPGWICFPDIREFPKMSIVLGSGTAFGQTKGTLMDSRRGEVMSRPHWIRELCQTCLPRLHVKDAIWCDYPKENRNRPQSKVCPAHTQV